MTQLFHTLRKNPFVDFVVTIVVAVAIAYVVQLWIVKPFQIPSGSMLQTFHLGDRIIAARFLYHFTDPKRGDIVVFYPNGVGSEARNVPSAASVVFVKRLIGLPGEWIQSGGRQVQVCRGRGTGCRTLREPYISSPQRPFGPTQIPAGHYFMMGDNRDDSADSRVWGSIPRRQIIGRAFMIYWPISRVRFF